MKWILLLIIGAMIVAGCVSQAQNGVDNSGAADAVDKEVIAMEKCMILCRQNMRNDLSDGPCLSDGNAEWNIEDWVCDVAHSPRTEIDDLPENQCWEFREGRAEHFVEVDPGCEFIRAV